MNYISARSADASKYLLIINQIVLCWVQVFKFLKPIQSALS